MPDEKPDFIDPVEDCPLRSPREILARYGYEALPPCELSDQQLPGRLWELLYAAAARRFFFCYTNHLSDRSFFQLLWDQWLDAPTPDIPLEAETNTSLDISDYSAEGMTGDVIWMRYYATDDDQALWRSSDPGIVFPPHENPPFDRDRFLPVSAVPLEAHAGWLPGDDDPPETAESDPVENGAVDSGELSAGDALAQAQLEATEPENWTPPAERLIEENVPLLPPAEITDETLTPILWELLHNLALRGFYVLNSNHLSDREVYAELWERGLRDPAYLPGRNLRGGWFHDFIGSYGDEDMQIWLRYYASDEQRANHAAEFPKDPMPRKETAPYNRDWRLPKGPFG